MTALGGGLGFGVAPLHGVVPLTLGAGAVGSVMVWLGVLFVSVLVGGFVLLFIRRWLLESGEDASGGWDLRSLRLMRERGEIAEEEYETARAQIIGAVAGPGKSVAPRGAVRGAGAMPDSGGALRAAPGFDLTGEPLPEFSEHEEEGESGAEGPKK